MNENKKLGIIAGVIAVFAIMIVVFAMNGSKKIELVYQNFESAYNGSENSLIYIGRPTCQYCNLLSPSLEEMKDRYDFDYIYINVDEFNTKYLTMVMEKLDLTSIGTPYLAVVNNGKIVDTLEEYKDYDLTFEFLQENGIIAEDAELPLNYIGLSEYKELLASDTPNLIIVGQSTCYYCVQAKLLLNQIADEKGVEINYFNISYLDNEKGEVTEFTGSLDYFSGEWGTPLTLLVKDGEIVDKIEQLVSKAEYIEFLEKNGVIE